MIDDGDVTQIMFRLDTDNDDKISYGEFKEIFYQIGDDIDYLPKKEVTANNNNYKDVSYSFANKENYNYNNNKKLYEKYINYNNVYDDDNDNNNDHDHDNDHDNNYVNKKVKDYNDDNNKYKRNYDSKEEEDEDEEKSNEKKGKKTKKKVLKPANNDNNSNVLHSQEPIKNYIKKNPQEISSSKYPDLNNNNSTDNYTLNLISKYSCNNNHKGLDSEDNSDDNESEYKCDSKINKRMKLKRKISQTKEELEDKSSNEKIEENNYEKNTNTYKEYNKRFLSSNNDNENDNNDEYNNLKFNNEKCKECQLSSKNMYDNLRERNNNRESNQTKKENKKDISDYDENSNTLFMDRNRNNTYANNNEFKYESTLNEPKSGIYKRKEELLRKYLGSYNNYYDNDKENDNNNYDLDVDRNKNDKSNYYFDSKKNISTRVNKDFSSRKMDKYNNNNEDNDVYGNDKKGLKKITEDRYIRNDSNSNSPKRNHDDQDNSNDRPIFSERFKRVKESKNNYFESSSTPLRSNPIQKKMFNGVPLNGDNLKQKKDLFFKLLVDYIEGGSNEEIKGMITKAANNIYFDLFEDIKKENKPGIQRDDIDKFMNENGYNAKDEEIEIIMEKMDKNKDGVIDYEEFIGEVQSKKY